MYDALCLVNLLHHKLDYMHIKFFQVHRSDHVATQTAACSVTWGTANAQGLLLFDTVAEHLTFKSNVSETHHHVMKCKSRSNQMGAKGKLIGNKWGQTGKS